MQHQKQPEIVVLAPVSAKTWCCLASFFASLSLLFLFLFLSLLLLRMFCCGSLSSLSCPSEGFGLQPALSGLLTALVSHSRPPPEGRGLRSPLPRVVFGVWALPGVFSFPPIQQRVRAAGRLAGWRDV